MSDFLKSEILRSVSGLAMIGVASFVVLIPFMMLTVGPSLDSLRHVDDGTATRMVFGVIASSAIAAMYLGSYSISREFYYNSLPRSLVVGSWRRVFASKVIASTIAGVILCLAGQAIWTAVTLMVLARNGRALQLDGSFWSIAAGSVFAAACGAAIGVALGWIVRNYYAVSVIVLLIPLMIELPLLFTVPEAERFLPVGAIAAVTSVPVDGLLSCWTGGAVLLGWCIAFTAFAVLLVRRREH